MNEQFHSLLLPFSFMKYFQMYSHSSETTPSQTTKRSTTKFKLFALEMIKVIDIVIDNLPGSLVKSLCTCRQAMCRVKVLLRYL